jgi:hypothetical protein
MPGVARQLYLPYGPRRLIKPRGLPQVINPLKPRGLILSAALADASFKLAYWGDKFDPTPHYTSSPKIGTTPKGMGLALATSGGTTCVSYAYNGQPPTTWSMECWAFVTAATFSGTVCGFNQNVGGNSATFDRQIADAGGGVWSGMLFDGGTKTASTGISETTLGLLHFVATTDGSNLKGYGNGKLNTTTPVSNGGFTGYSPPAYFCIGASSNSGAYNAITPLLVNFANVAWTDQEVLARYTNPFGFLRWPEDRRHYLVGVAGAGAQNLAPSLFTNASTFFGPTVGRGAVNLTPSLFTNTSTFFAPTVSSVANLAPSLFTNPNTFFSPTVASIAALAPSLFTNNSVFFSPTVVGAGNLAPSLFTNTNTFFSPTVTPGAVNLAPTLFANSNIFYSPTVALAQPQALLPSLYSNPNIFFLPVVHSHIVLLNVHVKLKAPHVFDNTEWPAETVFGPPDGKPVPEDFQYTPLMEGLSSDSIAAIAQTNIDIFGRYDAHGNLLDNPPIPRPIYDPQPTPAIGDKHFLPLGNGSWP